MVIFSNIFVLVLISLFGSASIAVTQAHSGKSMDYSSLSSETHVAQMGICQVGAGGPCNADTNSVK